MAPALFSIAGHQTSVALCFIYLRSDPPDSYCLTQCARYPPASNVATNKYQKSLKTPAPRQCAAHEYPPATMERFLREWRQDAASRNQYESAIFVGDKLLALTGRPWMVPRRRTADHGYQTATKTRSAWQSSISSPAITTVRKASSLGKTSCPETWNADISRLIAISSKGGSTRLSLS